jgi:tetratricopeptide (TPR) repeat protein
MGYSGFPKVDAKAMKPLIPLVLLLAACAAPGPETPGPDELAPDFGSPGEAGYHLFMAEIALQRDRPALAATEYLRAARVSDDPDVAARATRVISAFGTLEEGIEAAQRWQALAPGDLHPRRFLARFYLQGGEVEPAAVELGALRAAIDADSVEHPFLPLLPLAMEAHDPAVALAAMTLAVDGYPEDASGAYARGYLALRAGDAALGEAAAARALALAPDWTDAAMLYARAVAASGRTDEALDWLAAQPGAGDRRMRLERAIMLMSAERIGEGRQLLEDLLGEAPDDAEALRALGYLEYFDGRMDVAREVFTALLHSGEYTSDAFFYLASIAEQQGDIEEAAQFYARVEDGENLYTAQVRLALLMFRMGRPELAISHLELFERRNPAAAVELGRRARSCWPASACRMRPCRSMATSWPASRMISAPATRAACCTCSSAGSRTRWRISATWSPPTRTSPTALNALGYTLTDMTNRHDEAYQLIYRALGMQPENPAILDSMGWVLFRLGRPEEGLPFVERSWELMPDAEIAAHLGEILWALGRKDEARETWLEAIVEWPGNRILLDTMGRLDP